MAKGPRTLAPGVEVFLHCYMLAASYLRTTWRKNLTYFSCIIYFVSEKVVDFFPECRVIYYYHRLKGFNCIREIVFALIFFLKKDYISFHEIYKKKEFRGSIFVPTVYTIAS